MSILEGVPGVNAPAARYMSRLRGGSGPDQAGCNCWQHID